MKVVRKLKQKTPDSPEYAFFCPGCEYEHMFKTTGNEPKWEFNDDLEKPTVSPSIRVRWDREVCHFHLRRGWIQFLSDCTHKFAGETIQLREI